MAAIRSSSCGITMISMNCLERPEVQRFIGAEAYKKHKQARFRQAYNQNIAENQAFILSDGNASFVR